MRNLLTFLFCFIAVIAQEQQANLTTSDTLEGQKWLNEGRNAAQQANYAKAIVSIEKAIEILEKYPQSKDLGDAYYEMYMACGNSGKWDKSLGYAKLHHQYCVDNHLDIQVVGDAIYDVGYIYDVLNEKDSTIYYYLKSIEKYKQLDSLSTKSLGLAYHNLSFTYHTYGYLEEALTYAKKTYECWSESESQISEYRAAMYSNMARIYVDLNAIDIAEEYMEKVIDIRFKMKEENPLEYGMAIANLANLMNKDEAYEEGLIYGKQAIQIIENINNAKAKNNLAFTYDNLGHSYWNLKNYEESERAFKKSISLFPNRANSYINLLALYIDKKVGKYEEVLSRREEVEQISIQTNSPYLPLFYAVIAKAYAEKQQFDKAYQNSQYAINLASGEPKEMKISREKIFEIKDVPNTNNIQQIFRNRFMITKIYYEYTNEIDDLILAFEQGMFAIALLENDYKQRPYLQKNRNVASKEVYEEVIELAFLLFQKTNDVKYLEEGFQLSEQFKGNEILVGLNDAKAKIVGNLPNHLIDKERDIKVQLNFYKTELLTAKKKKQTDLMANLENKITTLQYDYETLMEVLKKDYPNYFDLKYQKTTIGIKDLQQRVLKEKEALIEYFVGKETIYIWSVQREKVTFHKKEKTAQINYLVETFRENIMNNEMRLADSDLAYRNYGNLATELFEITLSDVIKDSQLSKLLIVTDGVLNYLPFEILLSDFDEKTNINYKALPYLIKDYSIAYAQASKLLMYKKTKKAKQKLAAFAPEYANFSKEDTTNNSKLALLLRAGNVQLPAAMKEVQTITNLYQGKAFTHQNANEANFKKIAKDYQILHLSMHALIDTEFPFRSHLVFESVEGKEDNQLQLGELYNMNILADMVVLSACNSGFGQMRRGNGVQSLASAFNYAGAASTVMSLWRVPDQSTAPLMIDFYEALQTKQTKDSALRQAKIKYLENTVADELAHPFYWAGFIVSGDTSPILHDRYMSLGWWIGGGLLLLLIVWRFRR